MSKNVLFIQTSNRVLIIRHTTVITVTVDCKQGHLGAIVLVIARLVRTWLPPPPPFGCCTLFCGTGCCGPGLAGSFGFLGAGLAMGAPCLGGGGAEVRGCWFCNGFPWFGFWFGFGLRRAGNLHHSLDIHIPLPCNR